MTTKIFPAGAPLPFAAVLLAVFLSAALGALGQRAEAQTLDDMDLSGVVFPALNENDFLLFIEQLPSLQAGEDPIAFYKKKGVDPERGSLGSIKISINAMARLTGETEMLDKAGPTGVFSDSENKLFEKYQDQIVQGFVALALSQAK
jgi:hypothetical protein